MPSTYSPNLRIELIATGEQSGTWGVTTNTNLGTLIEDAIAGYTAVTVTSANQALTALNGAADQSRNMTIALSTTTSAAFSVYIPPAEKFYVIRNLSAYAATIYCSTTLGDTTAAGTGVTIAAGTTFQVCTDGTNVYEALNSFSGALTVTGSLTVNGTSTLGSTRLSATYSQSGTTVTVTTTTAHGYSTGNTIQFIPTSGDAQGGSYTITVTGTTSFTLTSALSQTTSGDAMVTNDTIRLNGVVQPGVVISSTAGTTYPALRITQTGTGNALVVEDSANPDQTPFVVDANGSVVVGALTTQTVNAQSTVYTPRLQNNQGGLTSAASLTSLWSDIISGPYLMLAKSRGSVGTHSIVQSGDAAGSLSFSGSDGVQFIEAARIRSEVDGTPGTNDMPGRLVFSTTADGASSPTERMRIDSQGRVGIGSSSLTTQRLRVQNNVTAISSTTNNILADGSHTLTANNAFAYQAIDAQSNIDQGAFNGTTLLASGGSVRGARGFVTASGASGTVTAASGFFTDVRNLGAGTLTNAVGFNAGVFVNSGGGTLTNAMGFYAAPNTAATNNYGFYSNLAAAVGAWNFYANGTAENYFGGATTINVNSTSDALRITQTGTGNALVVEDAANPDATPFVVDQNGRVIQGYTASAAIGGETPNIQVASGSSTNNGYGNYSWTASAGASYFDFAKSRSATIGTNAIVQSGDSLGFIKFYGDDGSAFVESARIFAQVDGTPGTNDMPGRLVFSTTADGASTPTERMRIDSAGRVLFGTTSARAFDSSTATITPSLQNEGIDAAGSSLSLMRNSTTNAGPVMFLGKSRSATLGGVTAIQSGDQFGQILFEGTDGAKLVEGAGIRAEVDGTPGLDDMPGRLVFSTTADGASSPTERMRIDSAGRLLVGTTATGARVNISTNSEEDALRITQTGTGNAFVVEDSTSPDATPFVIDANGKVFSGATSIINTYDAIPSNFSSHDTTVTGGFSAFRWAANTGGTLITLNKSRGATIGTRGLVGSADTLGNITWTGDDGATFIQAASISAATDGTPNTNNMPGRLVFSTTADGASTPTERMRINSFGQVLIGNTTSTDASVNLLISTATGTATPTPTEFRIQTTSSNADWSSTLPWGRLSFYNSDSSSSGPKVHAAIDATALTTAGGTSSLSFKTNDNLGNTLTERVLIRGSGNNLPSVELTNDSGLKISRTAVTSPAAADGNVFSGTYTPTLTNVTNLDASTASSCQYMRVGNVVTVSGSFSADPTATGNTELGISLPIASNFALFSQLGGTAAATAFNNDNPVSIGADATNDRAQVRWVTTRTANTAYQFSFTYRVI